MTVQGKWAECSVPVMSGNVQGRKLILAGLKGCISSLTAITFD